MPTAFTKPKPESALELVPLIIAEIYQLSGQLRRNADAIARASGQTQARWQVLSAASDRLQTVPQIARRLGLARQNIQRVADELVEGGLASFSANPDHKSSPHLALTENGRQVLVDLQRGAGAYYRQLAGELSPPDLITVRRGLRELCKALDRREPIPSPKSRSPGARR